MSMVDPEGRGLPLAMRHYSRPLSAIASPLQLGNLVAWWDFTDIASLWKDTARTSAVSADGDVVKGVTDKSGNARHLSEATNGPAYKVNRQNGLSGLLFDGVNDQLTAADDNAWSPATADSTWFFVLKSAAAVFSRVAGKANLEWDFVINNATTIRSTVYTSTSTNFEQMTTGSITPTNANQFTLQLSGTAASGAIASNGAAGSTVATGGTIQPNQVGSLFFGHRGDASSFFAGDLYEIFVVSGLASAAVRQQAEAYQKLKLGTP